MWPSIGNWQQACQSHYVIEDGRVVWCGQWTPEEVLAGRHREQRRRQAYYDNKRTGWLSNVWAWLKRLLG
jgi:hypothetical protein